jgi:hypothetical protein
MAGRPVLRIRLGATENLGAEVFLHVRAEGAPDSPIIVRAPLDAFERARAAGRLDGALTVAVDPSRAFVFDTDGRRLGRRPVDTTVVRMSVPAE